MNAVPTNPFIKIDIMCVWRIKLSDIYTLYPIKYNERNDFDGLIILPLVSTLHFANMTSQTNILRTTRTQIKLNVVTYHLTKSFCENSFSISIYACQWVY